MVRSSGVKSRGSRLASTVLIVDDSTTLRRMIKAALSGIDRARLVEAGDGFEAIEKLAITPIELVVLDLNMPDFPGIDVLHFIRSHERYSNLPVIILTTRGDDVSREQLLAAGATLYLTKPFDPATLRSHVTELLADGGQHVG